MELREKIKRFLLSNPEKTKGIYDDLWNKGDIQLSLLFDNSDEFDYYRLRLMFRKCEVFLSISELKELIYIIKKFERDIKRGNKQR